jgi:rhodanese-related sulfurtransferase
MKRTVRNYLVFLAIVGFFSGNLLVGSPAAGAVTGVTAKELKGLLDGGEDVTIIDVRTPEEYREGHIPGSISVPINTIEDLATLPYNGRVVVYCTAGVRSSKAGRMFAARGVEDLMDLKGGIKAWKKAGGELVIDAEGASDTEEEEVEYFTGLPPGSTVPKGVCEMDYAPNMKIGEDE